KLKTCKAVEHATTANMVMAGRTECSARPARGPSPWTTRPRTLRDTLCLPSAEREAAPTPQLGSLASDGENFSLVEATNSRAAGPQGHQDISDLLAWMRPLRRGGNVKGLSAIAAEIEEKNQ
ncbi:unnamed protein product, partial [Effrenium voratum]